MKRAPKQPPQSQVVIGCSDKQKGSEETVPIFSSTGLGLVEQTSFESLPDCLVVVDQDRKIVFANTAMEGLFGYPAAEVIGRPMELLIAERFQSDYVRRLQNYVESGRSLSGRFELRGRNKKGTDVPVEIRLGALKKAQRILIVHLVRDVTDRDCLRELFRQSQKLEPIALLAGGVANEFNNLLSVINSCSEMLVKNQRWDEGAQAMFLDIIKAGERAGQLTRRILTFHQKRPPMPRLVNMNELVTNTAGILRRLLGKSITVSTLLDPELGHVQADACQLEHALLNLAVNSRDAMPGGGELVFETANVDIKEGNGRVSPEGIPCGRYVMLAVTDTGCGMDDRTKTRIFEPLFTTKEPGKGTGLGLSTVAAIVKEHGGHIRVTSELGRGASFKLLLPRASVPLADPASARRGTQRVDGLFFDNASRQG
jgi:two-component system, cell cycle sensor histidine kinase and response regulator CckA